MKNPGKTNLMNNPDPIKAIKFRRHVFLVLPAPALTAAA
jgi:hypothetical protein